MSTLGFWQQIRQDNRDISIASNRLGSIGRPWFIFPQGGGPRGAFTSFESLKPNLRSRDVIIIGGVLREQAVAPDDVYDITVIGAANVPRQATDGGVPTGGGATWMAPASGAVATTPLLELVRQGWQIKNIAFNPHTASAGVRLTTAGGLDEAGQAQFEGCLFTGGGTTQIGIEDNGGSGMVQIIDCVFRNLGDTAIKGLTTANAVPSYWQILRCKFGQNTNDIKMSLAYASIMWNQHSTAGSGATNKVVSTIALSGQGSNNVVANNQFNNAIAAIIAGSGYSGSATDQWGPNQGTDNVKYGFV